MDKFNPDANNTPNQTEPKIGHGGERPDFELGNLDPREEARLLNELHSRDTVPDALVGRTQIEDSADTLARTNGPIITDTLQTTEVAEKPEKKKKGLLISLGGAAAGLAVAATAFFATQANNGDTNNTPPEKNPDDTTQVEPGTDSEEKPPVAEEEPTTPSAENDAPITAENEAQVLAELQLTPDMTPEQIGQRYTEVISRWTMAGATPDLPKKVFEEMLDDESLAIDIAKENTKVYATALLGENYEATASADLLSWVDKLEKINAQNIVNYNRSYNEPDLKNPNSLNEETWHTEFENLAVTVESEDESLAIITVRQKTHSNVAKTMYRDAGGIEDGSISDTHLSIDLSKEAPAITSVNVTDVK